VTVRVCVFNICNLWIQLNRDSELNSNNKIPVLGTAKKYDESSWGLKSIQESYLGYEVRCTLNGNVFDNTVIATPLIRLHHHHHRLKALVTWDSIECKPYQRKKNLSCTDVKNIQKKRYQKSNDCKSTRTFVCPAIIWNCDCGGTIVVPGHASCAFVARSESFPSAVKQNNNQEEGNSKGDWVDMKHFKIFKRRSRRL